MALARAAALSATGLVAALVLTLAMPVETWRTGDQGLEPLSDAPAAQPPELPRRLWIDTDAACGHGARTDPDDCLAIAFLARAAGDRIVGISTVAGNAPLEVVERTTRELAAQLARPLPVHSGAAGRKALIEALEQAPLAIVALGPLTNVAAALGERPDLQARIARVVAVMGRRPGHIFHPAEGAGGGLLFGHGPVFRDFNFAMDPPAVAAVVGAGVPLTLVPYDAARRIELDAADLERFAAAGGALAWSAARSRAWLGYWQRDIGRRGFYPFDLLAAAYMVAPGKFGCAEVDAWVGEDPTLFIPFWRPTALLVRARGAALYCGKPASDLKPWLIAHVDPAAARSTSK